MNRRMGERGGCFTHWKSERVSDVFGKIEAENYFAWLYEKTVSFSKVLDGTSCEFKK